MSNRPIENTLDVSAEDSGTDSGSSGGSNETMPLDTAPAASPWLMSAMRSAMDLPVVDRENYRVIAEHARGGLGRILKARDQRTGRIVAIKEMISAPSEEVSRRFAREALITANLQHPAIIPVYELGRWKTGELFYTMKFVIGRSFRAVIGGCKTLDERLARLSIVVSVAEALAYAHGKRVIHRDLKPANILVGDLGETVVIDWGLAKSIGEPDPSGEPDRVIIVPENIAPARTVAGQVMGTPSYMPPEQARGEPTDERADVYQIGALLYHLVAGVPPYHGRNAATSRELVHIVANEAPPPLFEREPGTPPDLATVVSKAMARMPADRYANAGELVDDLRRFTTGQLVRSHHYDSRTLFKRWARRNRAPLTVGAVLFVALLVLAAFSVRSILGERRLAEGQRDVARSEKQHAENELATALYEKGRGAEQNEEWARAAAYYAASRSYHDTPERAWAAGLAEARAVVPQARYLGHKTTWVRGAAISPDGERVATVDDAGELHLWSPIDGHAIASRQISKKPLYTVTFSPDGKEVATAGDSGEIFRVATGSDLAPVATLTGHVGRVWSVTYSPDGRLIASGGEDKTVRLWPVDATSNRMLIGHSQRVYSVAFSPDGKHLATGSDDRKLWVWDVATGKGGPRGDHKGGGIRGALYTPQGDSIVTTGWDHDVHVWQGDDPVSDTWNDNNVLESAALMPGGDVLVTGGESKAIHAWEISTHRLITSLEGVGHTSAVAISRDGRWLVTAGQLAPVAWDARPLQRLVGVGHRGEVSGLAFARDGKHFVSGAADHTLRAWDIATGTEIRRIATAAVRCQDGVLALDDGAIASACDDATLRRWEADGTTSVIKTPGWLRITALSNDGKQIAAGHEEGKVEFIDVPSWKFSFEKALHAHNIYGVQYARDGRLVTASLDDHARVWKLPSLEEDVDVRVGTDNGILTAALAPDGKLLAIGTQDGSIDVWDVVGGRWLTKGLGGGKMGVVWKLVYTPDGSRLLSVSDDGLLHIWNGSTWSLEDSLDASEGPALTLVVSPDGTRAVTGYRSGAIVIWDLRKRILETRIGGHTRERAKCSDIASQAWSDREHREIVAAACASNPAEYLHALVKRTHQRFEGEVDVTWEWLK